MTTRTPIYEARNISKSYGSVDALVGVNLKIHAGEVVGLVGDNGAGKSTLVKCLSGAHQPTSGQMFLDGQEVSWKTPHEAIEAGIETLYQESGLAPDLISEFKCFPWSRGNSSRSSRSPWIPSPKIYG
jgi:simple sugar transport system ATP-binding protein